MSQKEDPQDNPTPKKPLVDRLRESIRKPSTLIIAGSVFLLTVFAEYFISRAIDAIWEVEPPEAVVKLNSELQSASSHFETASKDLEALLSKIDQSKVEDPKLRAQLEQLDSKLSGLNELVKRTSQQTGKVATISEALMKDWVRLKNKSDRRIDNTPDLILAAGEGAQLCNGLTSIGVSNIRQKNILITTANKHTWLKPGSRVTINEQSYVDFIGTKDGNGLFKVQCGES